MFLLYQDQGREDVTDQVQARKEDLLFDANYANVFHQTLDVAERPNEVQKI